MGDLEEAWGRPSLMGGCGCGRLGAELLVRLGHTLRRGVGLLGAGTQRP